MFDRSLLPPADLEFVLITDTHFMRYQKEVEFASRHQQTARAAVALRAAASLDAEFVVHLGDLVQEYPDTKAFPQALAAALEQLRECGVAPRFVAGNHDIGDKPDPTMPTRPVSPESLDHYHDAVGPSWYSFDAGGCHFVVINSQILNTELEAVAKQKSWLERDLQDHSGSRIFLFLHLPPFLSDEQEAALGHYDNIAEPARGWLLDLVRRHRVELLAAAHVHCSFFDHLGATRYLILNSTSFTRPGFCHMFASAPPPDHGRDDAPKLGFYLCRVLADRTDLHFVRTEGRTDARIAELGDAQRLITRTPRALDSPPLALTLRHPLSTLTEIPLAWPSAIRQPVRNDYPLLSCLELGAGAVRVPGVDLADAFLAERLAILRAEGVRIVATLIGAPGLSVSDWLGRHGAQVDGLELQLAGTPWPTDEQLAALRDVTAQSVELSLSAIVPHEVLPGKQHARTRNGFLVGELEELNERLRAADVHLASILCRVDTSSGAWQGVRQIEALPAMSRIARVDASLELSTTDDERCATEVAEGLFAMALLRGSHLYVDPLVDFDRTMDVNHGLLDPLCNPRPAFHVARCLNTILVAERERLSEGEGFVSDDAQMLLESSRAQIFLFPHPQNSRMRTSGTVKPWRFYDLTNGLVLSSEGCFNGPSLWVVPREPK